MATMRSVIVVVDVVLARRLPDRAIDRGQVGDVDLFGVLVGEVDLGRREAEHVGAAVGQRDGRGVLVGVGRVVVEIDADPIGDQHVGVARGAEQDAEPRAARQRRSRDSTLRQRADDRLDQVWR